MPAQSGFAESISTTHLVKSEDLNHHQTLYGGRCVEWCVHMAYLAAQSCFSEMRPMVFMSIRNLSIRSPGRLGDIVRISGGVEFCGEATLGVRIEAKRVQPKDDQKVLATGTFLFCTVDERGKPTPHGLPAKRPESDAAAARWDRAVRGVEPSLR